MEIGGREGRFAYDDVCCECFGSGSRTMSLEYISSHEPRHHYPVPGEIDDAPESPHRWSCSSSSSSSSEERGP